MRKYITLVISLILSSFFVQATFAEDITITSNTTWSAGTYTYNNILITNGSVLTLNGAVTINANNLTIDSTSALSSDGKGYPAIRGPGAGTTGTHGYGGGGGYGGKGSSSYFDGPGGTTYGSLLEPLDLGSGGGSLFGGAGGGAIKLVALETLTLDGIISSNGANGEPYNFYGGGGSGGSIYITANSLTGNGTISANGGKGSTGAFNDGPYGGGGSGGRIAIYYNTSNFSGLIQAFGGKGYFQFQPYGGAGTIFIKSSNQKFGDLTIDNNNNSGAITQALETEYNFDNLNVLNKASAALPGNITSSNIILKNGAILDTLNNNAKIISDSILLELNSKIQGNLDMTTNNLTIDSTSALSSDGKGYPAIRGPGAGETGTHGYGGGAGYGGRGSSSYINYAAGGLTYGSLSYPLDLGSGGGSSVGGAGGGALQLKVLDTLTLNGTISSNGQDGKPYNFYGGGGSGGSIYIITNTLTGNGTISANGGKGSTGAFNDGPYGGGGGGGRAAVYYLNSSFIGRVESKGGIGYRNVAENGTVVFHVPSLDTPVTAFSLIEKSFITSILSETLLTQQATLNNVIVSGDLNGTLIFTNFEIIKVESGSFSGKGFSKGEFETNLEGITYKGIWSGIIYFIPSENKIYLKGEISGDINGICEGYLSEAIVQSGIYDKYQAVWKINRVGTDTVSVTSNLEGTLNYQSPHLFTSDLYLYQANMEGIAFGHYTGPLSAVVTHLRIKGENEYNGEGFSIISYNSALGQGQAYGYNKLISADKVEFSGLFEAPLLGKLSALLDEAKSSKTLSGIIERLELGIVPHPDLKVWVWSSYRVSPGEKINYIIEYRNDGLKSANEAIVYDYLDPVVNYISASRDAYYDPYSHQVSWNVGTLPAKTVGYLSIQAEILWGLPAHLLFENRAYIEDIVLHSTDENGFGNGIRYNSENINENKEYQEFTSLNNAEWIKLYDKTNEITGILEAYLASKNVRTLRNGVGESDLEIPGPIIFGNRPNWIFYSAGTITAVNQAKNGYMEGDTLYLISPQLITQEDVQAIKSKFRKIMIYQGDDLLPDGLFDFPSQNREQIISRAKSFDPPDNNIEALIKKAEQNEGKILKSLKLFRNEPGDKIKITWTNETNNETSIEFLITHNLQSTENIEVITLPGIKHEEWIPVLKKFKEKYERLPIPGDDDEKLIGTFKEFRKKTSSQSPQEIITANDPNEIIVSPEGDVRPADELSYTINYENVGEGIAYGVYITDTLDEDLDASTIEINNGGSYNSNTRTLSWFIGEVGPAQKGSVSFKVKVRADALDKSEVINFATIYFPSVPQATRTNGAVNRITTFIDNVPPVTTAASSPLPNQAGWNNTDVNINLIATDNENGLGVAKTEYSFDEINWLTYTDSFAIANEGLNKVYYKSTDNADNIETSKFIEIKIDKTLPILTVQSSPEPNTDGWSNTPVTVVFTASDLPSGITSLSESVLVNSEGANQYISGEAIDLAGNSATANTIVNIDLTPPEVFIGSPVQGAEYLLNAGIPAVWQVTDNLSGVASTTGTVSIGSSIDTVSVGLKRFSLSALDKAGNKIVLPLTYNVRYYYSGLLPPINPDGTSIFKLGRVVPVKFQLKDAIGNYISTAVAKLYLTKISNSVLGSEAEAESTGQANTGNLFRYSNIDRQYIFNLGTANLSEGTWQTRIELDDGSSKYATFSLK